MIEKNKQSTLELMEQWITRNIWNPILNLEVVALLVFLFASISHIGFTFQQGEDDGSLLALILGKSIGMGVEIMLVILAFSIVVKKSRQLFATIKEFRASKGKVQATKNSRTQQKKVPDLLVATDNKTGWLWGGMIFFAFVNFYGNFYYYLAILKESLSKSNVVFPQTGYPVNIITLQDIASIDPFVLFTRVFIFALFMPVVSLLMVEIIKFTVEQKALRDLDLLMKEDKDEEERVKQEKKEREKQNTQTKDKQQEKQETPRRIVKPSTNVLTENQATKDSVEEENDGQNKEGMDPYNNPNRLTIPGKK